MYIIVPLITEAGTVFREVALFCMQRSYSMRFDNEMNLAVEH